MRCGSDRRILDRIEKSPHASRFIQQCQKRPKIPRAFGDAEHAPKCVERVYLPVGSDGT
jgi:hypothetical protein